jgi:hypothetical protein
MGRFLRNSLPGNCACVALKLRYHYGALLQREIQGAALRGTQEIAVMANREARSGNASIKVSLAAGNGEQRPAGAYVAGQPGAGHQAPAEGAVHGELPVRQAPQLSPRPAPPPVARLCSSVSLLRCRSQTSPGQPFGPASAQSYNRPHMPGAKDGTRTGPRSSMPSRDRQAAELVDLRAVKLRWRKR